MQSAKPTTAQIRQWKEIYAAHRSGMQPDRKTGAKVNAYLQEKYPCEPLNDPAFTETVVYNIMENEHSRRKFPEGTQPDIAAYRIGNVLVGIDLVSGEFHVESENLEQTAQIYDELFMFRRLDEEDLKNYFLTAQYVLLSQKALKDKGDIE